MTPIQVTNLCKSYGDKLVLNNISFTLAPAETVCIMGQSGQGKTTLLHILMGLTSYDSGQISGIPFHKSAVFQENRLCESFSVLRNILMVCPKSVTQQQVLWHLEQVNLKENMLDKVSTLSGGMKRRVALVRAILAQKDILFLDEPFKGLDEKNKEQVLNYLKQQTQNQTVILVTHSLQEAQSLSARILNL